MGRNSRDEAKIKVRQPIQDVIIDSKYKNIIGDMEELIKEELNVKEVKYIDDMSEYMNISYRPNYREAGKYFGSDIKAFADYLNNITSDDISKLNNGNLKIKLNENEYDVTLNLVDVRISSKDGYDVVTSDDKAIILNTDLTYDLICEGLARETVSKIQQIRKNNGYDIVDRINIYYSSNDEYAKNISNYIDFIKDETLAINVNREDNIDTEISINDYVVGVRLEVVKK